MPSYVESSLKEEYNLSDFNMLDQTSLSQKIATFH